MGVFGLHCLLRGGWKPSPLGEAFRRPKAEVQRPPPERDLVHVRVLVLVLVFVIKRENEHETDDEPRTRSNARLSTSVDSAFAKPPPSGGGEGAHSERSGVGAVRAAASIPQAARRFPPPL